MHLYPKSFKNKISRISTITATLLLSLISPLGVISNSLEIQDVAAQTPTTQNRKAEADRLFQQGVEQFRQGQFQQSLKTYQRVLMIRRELGDKKGEGQTLNNIGEVYNNLNQYPTALEILQQALTICKELNDRAGEGETLDNIGLVYKGQRKYKEALEILQQALAIRREVKDRAGEGETLGNIGLVYYSLGQYPKVLEVWQQALAINREVKERYQEVQTLGRIAIWYQEQGNYQKMAEFAQLTLVVAREIKNRYMEGVALNLLGLAYLSLNDYQKAIEFFQASLAVARETNDVEAVTMSLTIIGGSYLILGDFQKAVEVLEQSLAIIRQIKQRQDEAQVLVTLGAAYSGLGEYQKAIELLQQGLAIARETKQRDNEGLALAQLALIQITSGLEDPQKTVELAQQALTIGQELKNRDIQLNAVVALSFAYASKPYSLKDPQKAVEFAKLALMLARQNKYRYLEAIALNALGASYSSVGDYQKTIEFAQAISKIAQEIKSPLMQWSSLFMPVDVYLQLGDYQKAINLLEQSLTIGQQFKNSDVEGSTLAILSYAYTGQGNTQKALELAQKSLNTAQAIKSPGLELSALWSLSHVYGTVGNYEKAIQFSEAHLAKARGTQNRDEERDALINLGKLYNKVGKRELAIKAYQEALAIKVTTEIAGRNFQPLAGLARIYRDSNQPQEAIKYYQDAIKDIEQTRVNIQGLSPALQESFLQNLHDRVNRVKTVDIYREYADLLLKQGRITEAQQVLDLLKVQELKAYLNNVPERSLPSGQPKVGINAILDRAVALGKELDTLESIPPNRITSAQQQRIVELRKIQQEINEKFWEFINSPDVKQLAAELQKNSGGESLNLETQVRTVQDNLKRLQQDAVILYPFVLKDRLELILATPYGPPIHRTVAVTQEELYSTVEQFRRELQDPSSNAKVTAGKLYEWLIKPIEKDLGEAKTKTIIYAPDGKLRYVPLAVLHDGNQWLVQRFRVNNITSLSLMDLNTKAAAKLQVLAAAFADTERLVKVKIGDEELTYRGLHFAGREVEGIAAKIPGTKKFVDEQFNPSIVGLMDGNSVVHLATHAAFVDGQPNDSFILFGDGSYVTLPNIRAGWRLKNVDLVVLSACQTALGKLSNGYEILGFGYQIQQTSARAAVATLWSVNDGGTQAFMDVFYATLQKPNTTKAEALRQAQVALITGDYTVLGKDQRGIKIKPISHSLPSKVSSNLSHPYYWAPFILIGNGL